jgi:phosphoserine phosphatase
MAIRIAFFDLEGTLLRKAYHLDDGRVAPSAWTLLAEKLGPNALAEENASKDKWNAKGYAGYVEWMEDTIRIHQKYGLTRAIFEEVMNSVEMIPGVDEVVGAFHAAGVKTAVISGAFKFLADRLQRKLKITHSFCACEYFFDGSGKIEHWNVLPADFEGKVDFMKLTMKEHKIDPAEALFVGDGNNDVHMAEAVGISIAFNAQDLLCEKCTFEIRQPNGEENFCAVLDIVRQHKLL